MEMRFRRLERIVFMSCSTGKWVNDLDGAAAAAFAKTAAATQKKEKRKFGE